MKRKFLLLLMLLGLVLPVAAGCGNDDDTSEAGPGEIVVSTEVARNPTLKQEDQIYRVEDCARMTGDGVYSKNNYVTVSVEFLENVCSLYGWRINGVDKPLPMENTSGNATLNLPPSDFANFNSLKIEALITSSKVQSQGGRLYFSGIRMTSSDSEYTESKGNTRFGFYVMENNYSQPIQQVREDFVSEEQYVEIKSNEVTTLAELIIPTQKANLNYLYVKSGTGNFTLHPNKLKWYKGEFATAGCSYANKILIEDPNTFSLPLGKFTCVVAEVSNELSGKNALETFLESKAYISTSSSDACYTNSNSTVPVSENCSYVYKIANLYNRNISTMYYGINENGNLEAVSSSGTTKNYYLCTASADRRNGCPENNSLKIPYPQKYKTDGEVEINEAYKMLKIAPLIDALIAGTVVVDEYQYDELSDSITVKTLKVGTTTYYVKPSTSANYYNPTNLVNAFSVLKNANMINIVSDNYKVLVNGQSYYFENVSTNTNVNPSITVDNTKYTLIRDSDDISSIITKAKIESTINTTLSTNNDFELAGTIIKYNTDILPYKLELQDGEEIIANSDGKFVLTMENSTLTITIEGNNVICVGETLTDVINESEMPSVYTGSIFVRGDALDEVLSKEFIINDKLFINPTQDTVAAAVNEKLYSLINATGSNYNSLKNYIFDIKLQASVVSITYKDAMIDDLFDQNNLIVIEDDGDISICASDDSDCVSNKRFYGYLDYLMKGGNKQLSDLHKIKSITRISNNEIEYIFVEDTTTNIETKIKYNYSTKVFTMGYSKITFVNATGSEVDYDIATIASEIKTIFGTGKQVLTISQGDTKDDIDHQDVESFWNESLVTIDDCEEIVELGKLLVEAEFYSNIVNGKTIIMANDRAFELLTETSTNRSYIKYNGTTYYITLRTVE